MEKKLGLLINFYFQKKEIILYIFQLGKVTLGLNVRNLFNTKYERSGMNTKLIPQKGRWYMFDIAYKF